MINLAALAAIAVLGVVSRDANETLQNLHGIAAAANDWTRTINAWNGTSNGAIDVDASANALIDLLDAANYDASDEEVASSEDSVIIINYITDVAGSNITASLGALIAREADFQSAGVSSNVLSALQSLKQKTDGYGTTLWVITSTDQRDNVRPAISQLDSDFAAAIAAFS